MNYSTMNDIQQEFNKHIDLSDSSTLLFTTSITPSLISYLADDFNFEVTLRLLNLKEQLKIRSVQDDSIKIKRLINKLFTKVVLNYIIHSLNPEATYFNPWADLSFSYNRHGKPFLVEQNKYKFQFSLSSSNNILSLAIELNTENPIGVDLSHSRQDSISSVHFLEQFKPIFDKFEIGQLNSINDLHYRYVIFNQIWTLKEAFTKLLGSGLNIDISKFYFDLRGSLVDDNKTITVKDDNLISEFFIYWHSNIDVNIGELINENNPFTKQLNSKHFNCFSGILKNSTDNDLPVIVSIINQNNTNEDIIRNFNINFEEILKKLED